MDEQTTRRVDQIVEDEVRRGYAVKDLPTNLVQLLTAQQALEPDTPVLRRVRFNKLTPRKRRLINEAVLRRYHKDVQDKAILSNAQLRQFNIERGEWSIEMEEKLKDLQRRTTAMMQDLYMDGIDHRTRWTGEMLEAADTFRKAIHAAPEPGPMVDSDVMTLSTEEKTAVMARFERWFGYDPATKEAYAQYAIEQGLPEYSADRDLQKLLDRTPTEEAASALQDIEALRDKIRRYLEVLVLRRELVELQVRRDKMYAESVENRRDASEELARLYYSTDVLDEKDAPQGQLTQTLDQLWDLPEEVIQWLLVELSFFLNGIPDEVRGYLAEWGFIAAPQSSGSPASSDASLAEPSSNSDSAPPVMTPAVSSESLAPTN